MTRRPAPIPAAGVWGGIATYETNGKRYLYLPLYGHPSKDSPVFPTTNGETPNGRIMAFQVVSDAGKISAVPVWTSTDMIMPDPPVVANGGGLCAVHRRPGDAEHGQSRREAHDL